LGGSCGWLVHNLCYSGIAKERGDWSFDSVSQAWIKIFTKQGFLQSSKSSSLLKWVKLEHWIFVNFWQYFYWFSSSKFVFGQWATTVLILRNWFLFFDDVIFFKKEIWPLQIFISKFNGFWKFKNFNTSKYFRNSFEFLKNNG